MGIKYFFGAILRSVIRKFLSFFHYLVKNKIRNIKYLLKQFFLDYNRLRDLVMVKLNIQKLKNNNKQDCIVCTMK